MSGDDNDLEERKSDVWSMEETRGGGVNTADSSEGADTDRASDTPENSPPTDTTDASDTSATQATTTASEAAGTTATEETPDTQDTPDTSDNEEPSPTEQPSTQSETNQAGVTTDTSDTAVTTETAETAKTKDTADRTDGAETTTASVTPPANPTATGATVREMAQDADAKDLAVRDLHNVNVYLYEDVYQNMQVTYKELDTEYFAQHGEDLSKNKDFFNAVFKAGIESPQLKEELGIE